MPICTTSLRSKGTLLLALMLFIALFTFKAEKAQAQTPITQIENAAGDSVFVSFDDGALLGLGKISTGVIPTSGAGIRMMWHPAKAAFRVGSVTGTQWDDANIGFYSVGMGYNTTAKANYSTAIGYSTTANSYYSVAMGNSTTASATGATAMGVNTIASGVASTAMGDNTAAATSRSLSIGTYNSANTSADGTLFVVGKGDNTNLPSSRSDAFIVRDDGGILGLGEFSTGVIPLEGAGTRMMWHPAKGAFRAGQVNGTEWDEVNIGNSSVAMGYQTTASASASTAMGSSTTASTSSSLSIGIYNSANTSADGTLFVVGNGSSITPSDALVLEENGDMTISGTLTESSDRRLKNNIAPLDNGILDKLNTITPSQYQFKNQQTHPAGPQIGLIAQEVQQQFPELVSEASNGNLSVSYSKFTAVLLKGMQEQQTEIQTLKDENKNIKERLAKLEQQNSRVAGLPLSTFGSVLLGMGIGGTLWWRSRYEQES